MSQHDYSVANDTGANVRADLNNALQALASISSGASAPSTTYAYQWWGDTTNSVLKRRNANNSGWIVVRTLSESFVLTKTTAYTVVLADFAKTILCDASGGAFTVTLPAAATAGDGYKVTVKKSDSSANAVTVDGNSSETIDGATTKALSSQYDAIVLACDGSNWHLVADNAGGAPTTIGQHTIWMPAGAMEAAVTTAAATSNAVEVGTSLFAARTMDFATDADDYAYFGIQMPKSWDAGALVCQFVWSATGANANTVMWGLSAISLADDEVLTTAFGAPTTQIDTNSTTADDIMISPEVSVTVGSTPTAEDYLMFEVMRDVSGDNLAEDARLHGIKIHYTTDAGSDT